MQTVLIDTHDVVKALLASGFSEDQAETICETIQSIDLTHLATKSDLKEQTATIRQEMADLRGELRQEMADLRGELRQEMAQVKFDIIKYITPILLGQAALIVALIKFI